MTGQGTGVLKKRAHRLSITAGCRYAAPFRTRWAELPC